MNLVKSKQRVTDHGEVFTPPWMVEAMLDLVKAETERIDARFLEPACGSGNFICRILAKDKKLSTKEQKELSDAEKEYRSKRKLIQEKLIKFATRIPAFMYLTDFRENTLQDVITKLESDLFLTVTGLTVQDFHLLVRLKVFNTEQMNQAVFAFRRYEDASLRYTGIESHVGLTHYGLYDTVVAKEADPARYV